jgi:hypothetical protein
MPTDPVEEGRSLAEGYREMGDEELRNLADDFTDLTESAQQALRQEMRNRGMSGKDAANGSPQVSPPGSQAPAVRPGAAVTEEFDPITGRIGAAFGIGGPKLVPDAPNEDKDDSGPHDYTWKTVLCECETLHEARQLVQALQTAGLDGWVQGSHEFGRRYSQVLVAADQLDQARLIAAQPIPKEVVDESQEETPEFVEPKCPKCGSDDVVLEGVDTQNHWRCESCDAEWSDEAEGEADRAASASETKS